MAFIQARQLTNGQTGSPINPDVPLMREKEKVNTELLFCHWLEMHLGSSSSYYYMLDLKNPEVGPAHLVQVL